VWHAERRRGTRRRPFELSDQRFGVQIEPTTSERTTASGSNRGRRRRAAAGGDEVGEVVVDGPR
jgi:hypothetical protein